MTIADPQAIFINAVNKSLPRLGGNENSSSYRLDDGSDVWGLEFSHSTTKGRIRHLAKLTQTSVAADVYQPSVNAISKMSAHLVADVPVVGFAAIDQIYLILGLCDKLKADANLLMTKLTNGES